MTRREMDVAIGEIRVGVVKNFSITRTDEEIVPSERRRAVILFLEFSSSRAVGAFLSFCSFSYHLLTYF